LGILMGGVLRGFRGWKKQLGPVSCGARPPPPRGEGEGSSPGFLPRFRLKKIPDTAPGEDRAPPSPWGLWVRGEGGGALGAADVEVDGLAGVGIVEAADEGAAAGEGRLVPALADVPGEDARPVEGAVGHRGLHHALAGGTALPQDLRPCGRGGGR